MSDSLQPHQLQHARLPCFSLSPWVCSLLIEPVMPSTISSSGVPFSCCCQSFPASGSFPMCQLFTLIHRPIILCSYAIVFTVSDFTYNTSTTEHRFHLGPTTSFFLELLVIAFCSSPIAYGTPFALGAHLPVLYLFAFSYCSSGSPSKNTGMGFHLFLQWTTFC